MRFDIISVFPEFFSVLDLSLVGKARERGIIEVTAHDLRNWTTDVHRTVDDAPFGGGAGMVMKPDVWAEAIDDVVTDGRSVLAIPTPSGAQLTQQVCWDLAEADQLIIACGRYEGIDARVAEHYRAAGMEVVEYSLGDYVLNGGEVAAIALVEAVARLLPGMVGNPESLREESHGEDGLLEYPVYTRPPEFRGIDVPRVLTSGDHGKVARWRRERALERTADRRPDMIAKLDPDALDKKAKAKLAELGWVVSDRVAHVEIAPVQVSEAGELSAFASHLFPDACPHDMSETDIASFVGEQLCEESFAQRVADDRYLVLGARVAGRLAGYAVAFFPATSGDVAATKTAGAPTELVLDGVERDGELVYLSKFYVDRPWRGSGLFDYFIKDTLRAIAEKCEGVQPYVWLGTNAGNKRAIRAYTRAGFVRAGVRDFIVGEKVNKDITLAIRARVPQ